MSFVFEDFSGKTKSFILNELAKKLNTEGDQMTGDLDMQTNFVHSTAIPNDNSDLVNKKYVNDEDTKKLSLTGGTMTGDITIGNNKIWSTSDPTGDKHLTRKKYVDDRDNVTLQVVYSKANEKLSLTGGTMTGDLNMGSHKIIKNSDPTEDTQLTRKKYVDDQDKQLNLIQSYILNSDFTFYGEIMDLPSYLKYVGSTKKVEIWYNQSRISNENFTETDPRKQPMIKDSHFFPNKKVLYFYGCDKKLTLNLNINTQSGKKDYLNFFLFI